MDFSFTGGGIRRTWRKPPTCRKSVTNLSHNVVSNTHPRARFELTTLVVIGTDCIGSYISNYHSITTTTVPKKCNFSKWKNSTKPGIKKEPHLGRAPKVEWDQDNGYTFCCYLQVRILEYLHYLITFKERIYCVDVNEFLHTRFLHKMFECLKNAMHLKGASDLVHVVIIILLMY